MLKRRTERTAGGGREPGPVHSGGAHADRGLPYPRCTDYRQIPLLRINTGSLAGFKNFNVRTAANYNRSKIRLRVDCYA
jgi:hypothetical protein